MKLVDLTRWTHPLQVRPVSGCGRRSKVRGDSPRFKGGGGCVVIQVILGAKEGANKRDVVKSREGGRVWGGVRTFKGTHIKKCSVQKLHGTTTLEI